MGDSFSDSLKETKTKIVKNKHHVLPLHPLSIDVSQIESPFMRDIIRIIKEGVACFNNEIVHIDHLIKGVANINSRQFFVSNENKIKDWVGYKKQSFEVAAHELSNSLYRVSQEILPNISELAKMAHDEAENSENESMQIAYQSFGRLQNSIERRKRQLAAAMCYLLAQCQAENELSVMAPQRFNYFCDYIFKYGLKHTQGEFIRLFFPDDPDAIQINIDTKEQPSSMPLKIAESTKNIGPFTRYPKSYWVTSWLPGDKVFNGFLQEQLFVVAQFNTRIQFFKQRKKKLENMLSREFKQNVDKVKTAQENMNKINQSLVSLKMDTLKKLLVESEYLKSQADFLQDAINEIEKKKLSGWRLAIAFLFGRNPNPWLKQWQEAYQIQQHRIMEDKLRLFEETLHYAKEDFSLFDRPLPSLIRLLKSQAKDLEDAVFQQTNFDFFEKFTHLYEECDKLIDPTRLFITSIENEDPNYVRWEPIEKNGLTVFLPNEQSLVFIVQRLLRYGPSEKKETIQSIYHWLHGEHLPNNLSSMRERLSVLFSNDQKLNVFIKVLIEKYIAKTVCSSHSLGFQLLQEHSPSFADNWLKERKFHAFDARFFLDSLLELTTEQRETLIIVNDHSLLPSVSNAIQQIQILKSLSSNFPNHRDYWNDFKKTLKDKFLVKNSIIYSHLDFIEFIACIDDEGLIAIYGNTLFDLLMEERKPEKFKNFDHFDVNIHKDLKITFEKRLDQLILQEKWDPFVGDVIEAFGSQSQKQIYRLRRLEHCLKTDESKFDYLQGRQDETLEDLIQHFGETNIPKLIQLMENFLKQETIKIGHALALVRRYVTPELVEKFNAVKLKHQLKTHVDKLDQEKTNKEEAHEMIEKLRQLQLDHSRDVSSIYHDQIQSKIKAIFHRLSLNAEIREEFEKDHQLIGEVLKEFNILLSEIITNENPKIINAWMNKFDLTQQPLSYTPHAVLSIPPFPQPYLWLFIKDIQTGLNQLTKVAQGSLQIQLDSICKQFVHLTKVASFFVEKIENPYVFTLVKHQAENGLMIKAPHQTELTELVEYVLKQPISENEKKAIILIEQLLKGNSTISSLDVLKLEIRSLFTMCPNPQNALNQFVKVLFERYVIQGISNPRSPSFSLLQQYDSFKAKAWIEKQRPQVEISLYFFQEIFRSHRITDDTDSILCGGEAIHPAIENIKMHIQRIRDFSDEEMDYFSELKKLAQNYINNTSFQKESSSLHHQVIDLIGNPTIIVDYSVKRFETMMRQNQFKEIINHPFFQKHQNNEVLQNALVDVCLSHFKSNSAWNEQYPELITYFSKEMQIKLLNGLIGTQEMWNAKFEELVNTVDNETIKQAYRLRLFIAVLNDDPFAKNFNDEDLIKKEPSLESLYGDENIPTIFHHIVLFINDKRTCERAVKLIDHYLTEESNKKSQLGPLFSQWATYKMSLFKDSERENTVFNIMKNLEDEDYHCARSKLNLVLDNLSHYGEGRERYHQHVGILDRLLIELDVYIRKCIEANDPQRIALVESYFITLFPDDSRKMQLTALCQSHCRDYFFEKNDLFSLNLYLLYHTLIKNFDDQLWNDLKFEFSTDQNKNDSIARLKVIHQKMIAHKIASIESFDHLTPEDRKLLKISGERVSFFNRNNDPTIKVAISISVKAHLLGKEIGKKTNILRPMIEFLEKVRELNQYASDNIENVRNKEIKKLLFGIYGDGFLSEFPELMALEGSSDDKKLACKEACAKIVKNNKKDFEAIRNYGDALFATGCYRKAVMCYQQILNNNPKDEQAHVNMIIAKYRSHKYQEVITDTSRVIKCMAVMNGDLLICYRAKAYQKLLQYDKARSDIDYLKKKNFQMNNEKNYLQK